MGRIRVWFKLRSAWDAFIVTMLANLWTTRGILLLDGIGAVVTALSVGVVLPLLQPWIGVPSLALYLLGGGAAVLALVSLTHHFSGRTTASALRLVAAANLTYIVLTAALLLWLWPAPTFLALLYFGGESAIVAMLARRELALAAILA